VVDEGQTAMIDYSPAQNYADIVRALAIVESQEQPNAVGDNGQARGLLQIHPAQFRQYYGASATFLADIHDTWIEADIKCCAAYLDKWDNISLDLRIMGWNLGINAVVEGKRNPEYLAKFDAAYNQVKGQHGSSTPAPTAT